MSSSKCRSTYWFSSLFNISKENLGGPAKDMRVFYAKSGGRFLEINHNFRRLNFYGTN